ncbi:MAG: hypothetical protein GXO39_07750 [Thermotogae bacterium]|nr:hypothetical protein [Thermotogota bacterium]
MLILSVLASSDFQLKKVIKAKPDGAHLLKKPSTGTVPRVMGIIDGYGYMLLSNQLGDPVTFNYIDISSTGTAVGAGDDWCSVSSASTPYSLGFSMPYYDRTITDVSICSNGTVVLENISRYVGFSNAMLPDSNYGFVGFIAPMWDDLNPSQSGADDIYFQSFSSCPDGYSGACAVVQYHLVPRYGGSVYMDFEVVFYDNGNIKIQYNSAIDYNDATVGMQDSSAAEGSNPDWYIQYVYNGTPYTQIPDSGTAILFKLIPIQSGDAIVMDVNPDEYIPTAPVDVEAQIYNADTLDLTGFLLHLDIYDTVTNTIVFSDDQSVTLNARSINTVTFSTFTPADRSYYRAVVYVTDSRDPDPTYDTASTVFRTHVRVGDVLDTMALRQPPLLGYNFSFITYNDLRARFFISDFYGGVYSFEPRNPSASFRYENWAFAPIYDPYVNHTFSIANDGDSLFFLSHLEYDGWYVYSQHVATYSEVTPGVFAWTGDTINLLSLYSAISYGMDWDGEDQALWIVASDGSNHALVEVSATDGTLLRNIPLSGILDVPTGLTILDYTGEFLISDGKFVYRLDTLGNVVDAYYTPGALGAYDLAFYPSCSPGDTDPVVVYAVAGDSLNTVMRVATGYYCDQLVSIAEKPKVERENVAFHMKGRTVYLTGAEGMVQVYDIAGRRVATFNASSPYTFNRSGVFFIKTDRKVFKIVVQ